jgi:release factor glutamine methyltransferase
VKNREINTVDIRTALDKGASALSRTSGSPRLDAELLLSAALGCNRLALITRSEEPVSPDAERRFLGLIERRARHEPVAYLIGQQEFWSLPFHVAPGVLIPRPETELLVELTLAKLAEAKSSARLRVLDLGTGSGCIAAALARELQLRDREFLIVAVDRSHVALEIARRNFLDLGLPLVNEVDMGGRSQELVTIVSDWCAAFSAPGASQELRDLRFDVVVSNPPYVDPEAHDTSPEIRFEPREALFAPERGLRDILRIAQESRPFIQNGGVLLIEIGSEQGAALLAHPILQGLYSEMQVERDLAGLDRVLRLRP